MQPRISNCLPDALYSVEQTRQMDRLAIAQHNISGILLMRSAGQAAFDLIQQKWPKANRLLVFCGGGNNAGDGYIVAALARLSNFSVDVVALKEPQALSGDAKLAYQFAVESGVNVANWDERSVEFFKTSSHHNAVIVDALLGTGFSGELRVDYQQAVERINGSDLPVLCLDVPSGLNANTGAIESIAVSATITLSFAGINAGLVTGLAADVIGALYFASIGMPAGVYEHLKPVAKCLALDELLQKLPARKPTLHKGGLGKLLLVGGNHGMAGAVVMAVEAAARSGAGLLRVITQNAHAGIVLNRRPEAMVVASEDSARLAQAISQSSCIAIGPGLGTDHWACERLHEALSTEYPLVVDADALNLLASLKHKTLTGHDELYSVFSTRLSSGDAKWVLTPHPGEAAKLLNTSVSKVQSDRYAAAKSLQKLYGGVVLLKGAGTVIANSDSLYVARVGNPGMASGGMGDILTGVIAALIVQGMCLSDAACLGAMLHGQAADDIAENEGQRGIVATDLLPYIRRRLNASISDNLSGYSVNALIR